MPIIADETVLYHSPDPAGLYCYTPWIDHAFNGRLAASFDIAGPSLKKESGPFSDHGDYGANQLRIYLSDDNGMTWRESGRLPMLHARVFAAGKMLYALGHSGRLLISKSDDNGETWSQPAVLDDHYRWHQSSGGIDRANGKIWLTWEHTPDLEGWNGGDPLLMCADENADLTRAENWRFSETVAFSDVLERIRPPAGKQPHCWLESSLLFQRDKANLFYDPQFRNPLVFLRINGGTFPNCAGLLQGHEADDGTLSLSLPKLPGSDEFLYIPFPGGNMKFQTIWDETSGLYWLIASRPRRGTFLNKESELVPGFIKWFDERRQLELFYSANAFDWVPAGVVAAGETELQSRHYASLTTAGDDMLVLSRSGDANAKDTHDTDMITLHRIRNFRSLVTVSD